MKRTYIFLFVAVVVALANPNPASAECWWTLCDSYGVYDQYANEILGYSYTMDYSGYMYVAAVGTLTGPNGPVQSPPSYWEWGEAWVYYDYVPGQFGLYTIDASHYWSTEWDYWYYFDGTSSYEITAIDPNPWFPDEEVTESVEQYYGPEEFGGLFHLVLSPSGFWDGGIVTESLGTFVDECFAKGGTYRAAQPVPSGPKLVTNGGRYQDQLSVGSQWVQYYESKYYEYGACGWHGDQTVTFDALAGGTGVIAWNYMEIFVDGWGYGATRGPASAYWNGPF